MEKEPLIILAGPTAAGKTRLSLKLAGAVNGEILSADSMQVYQGMDIGTAKIKPEETRGIPHYLIDALRPDEPFHVCRFQELAKKSMARIRANGHIPVLVGGTGFYIQAVLYDIHFSEKEEDKTVREELSRRAAERGPAFLHRELERVDPASARSIHPNNIKKVIRALEFYRLTGQPISEHNEEEKKRHSPYRYRYFVLNEERDRLYANIDRRVDEMMRAGFLEEVKRLREAGYGRELPSMQGLGYRQLSAYLDGECALSEAVLRIKQETRHFAKRQLTWFRREKNVIWLNKPDFQYDEERMLEEMLHILREGGILS